MACCVIDDRGRWMPVRAMRSDPPDAGAARREAGAPTQNPQQD